MAKPKQMKQINMSDNLISQMIIKKNNLQEKILNDNQQVIPKEKWKNGMYLFYNTKVVETKHHGSL